MTSPRRFVALLVCCLVMSCEGSFRCDPSPSWTIGPTQGRDAATPACTPDDCPVWGMAVGARHACAIVGSEAELVCWGANDAGQIDFGRPSEPRTAARTGQRAALEWVITSSEAPVAAGPLSTCTTLGEEVICWGHPFGPPTSIPGRFARQLTVGLDDVCFVSGETSRTQCRSGRAADEVALAGPNRLALEPDLPARWTFVVPGVGRLADQRFAERELDLEYGIAGLTGRSARIGPMHGCAVSTRRAVARCFGRGERGQLGPDYVAVDAELGALPEDSDVVLPFASCSGGHLGAHLEGGEVVLDGPRGGHTCWSSGRGGVRCRGANDRGQLGNGQTTDSATPVDVVGLPPGAQHTLYCGGEFTCAASRAGVYCWGDNREHQLGIDAEDALMPIATRIDLALAFTR